MIAKWIGRSGASACLGGACGAWHFTYTDAFVICGLLMIGFWLNDDPRIWKRF